MATIVIGIAALFTGFLLDQILGDPEKWPHPIVAFGKAISFFEKRFNKGRFRFLKGTLTTLLLTGSVSAVSFFGLNLILDYSSIIWYVATFIIVFFCLAGCTLRKEVRLVFGVDVSSHWVLLLRTPKVMLRQLKCQLDAPIFLAFSL